MNKPCPCCGSTYVLAIKTKPPYEYAAIRCQQCGVTTSESYTEDGAWQLWNRRTAPPSTAAILAALKASPAAEDDPDTIDLSLPREDAEAALKEWGR